MQRKMDYAIKCYWKVKTALNNLLSVKNAIETLSYLYLVFIDVLKKFISIRYAHFFKQNKSFEFPSSTNSIKYFVWKN